jgi:hypothetical protein
VSDVAFLVLAVVQLALSVAVLVYARRASRTWRQAALGWEQRARAAEAEAERLSKRIRDRS